MNKNGLDINFNTGNVITIIILIITLVITFVGTAKKEEFMELKERVAVNEKAQNGVIEDLSEMNKKLDKIYEMLMEENKGK